MVYVCDPSVCVTGCEWQLLTVQAPLLFGSCLDGCVVVVRCGYVFCDPVCVYLGVCQHLCWVWTCVWLTEDVGGVVTVC